MKKPTYILTKELNEHLADLKRRLDFLESENKKYKTLQAQCQTVASKLNKINSLINNSKTERVDIANIIKEVVTLDFINKLYGK